MGYCAVVDCDEFGMNVVTIATSWGAWEHSICDQHKKEVDGGARMDHDPGYRVTLHAVGAELIPEQTRGGDHDVRVRPLRPRRHRPSRTV